MSIKTSHSAIDHLFLILRLKWRLLLLLVQILLNRNLRSHSHLLNGIFGKLVVIGSRRVAAVRVRRIRFLVFHLEIDLQIQVVFLNTLMTLDLCKSSFHIIVILVIRIMLYLVKL